MYFHRALQFLYSAVLLAHNVLQLLVLAGLVELHLLGNFLLLPGVPALLHEGLYLAVSSLQDSFDDVGSAGDDVLDVVLADLVVQLF